MKLQFAVPMIALLLMAPSDQAAAGTLSSAGNIAHLAWNGGWQTVIFFNNYGAADATVAVNFFGDDGAPKGVPLTNVYNGQPGLTGAPVTSLNFTMKAGTMSVFSAEVEGGAEDHGWAQVLSDVTTIKSGVDFKYSSGNSRGEAMAMADQSSTRTWDLLFFGEKDGVGCDNAWEFTSYAIANVTNAPVTFTRTVTDRISGAFVFQDSVTLQAHGHTGFLAWDLAQQPDSPASGAPAGLWMMRVTAPGAGQITPLTLHFRQEKSACVLGARIFESVPNWEIQ